MSEIYGEYLRLLRVRDKDAKISGGHPARGVWSGLGKESPDVTRTNIWNAQFLIAILAIALYELTYTR